MKSIGFKREIKKNLLTSKEIEFIKQCMFYFLDDRYTSMDSEHELRNLEYKVNCIDEKLCEMENSIIYKLVGDK
jgi:diphthamide biosynthesis methyltransferase